MGLLTGFAFVLFFALASVPIARAADRYSRRNIIAVALTFWSVMTMLSGTSPLSCNSRQRESVWASVKRQWHRRRRRCSRISFPEIAGWLRSTLLAVAAPVGTMMAFTIGGMLNAAIGWRMTFVALGAPGLFLAAVMLLTIREPRRGASEAQSVDVKPIRSPIRSLICGAFARCGSSRRVRPSISSQRRRKWPGARPS